MEDLERKEAPLRALVAQLGSAAVAYSGGADSTYLLAVCLDVLGADRVLAVTEDSPLIPRAELEHALAQAAELGARHLVLSNDDLANPDIVANTADRCYHCKLALFRALLDVGRVHGMAQVVFGENLDDADDYRPGRRAAVELGIRAPLLEAGLTKAEVRALSRHRNLSTWDRPANPCLASRIPYGTPLSSEALARVEAAEAALQDVWGPLPLRVRDHYPVARLEVPPREISRLAQPEVRAVALERLRDLGYRYVTLDLAGYRMGSLNDALPAAARAAQVQNEDSSGGPQTGTSKAAEDSPSPQAA